MAKKKRIEYLICTLSVAISGFLIYGSIGAMSRFINGSAIQSFFAFGCLGGFGFSAVVSTIILSADFFKKRGLAFKVVAAVLWPITFAACVYAGMLSYIPYQIFNIVKLVSIVKEEKKAQQSENNSEELNSFTD
jgi:hypothetical protein